MPVMPERMEAPNLEALRGLPVEIAQARSRGSWLSPAKASNGDVVSLAWDEIAASVRFNWLVDDAERLVLEREEISQLSVHEEQGEIHFRIWCRTDGLGGELVARVGDDVAFSDVLLRR